MGRRVSVAKAASWVRDSGEAASSRSNQAKALLRKEWNDRVKHLPPKLREAWLDDIGGRICHGLLSSEKMVRDIRAARLAVQLTFPSSSWAEAWDVEGIDLPRQPAELRGAVRMKRRRRSDDPLLAHAPRRWTPPQCFESEEALDLMTVQEAVHYDHPTSPSALAISQIAMRKAVEQRFKGREGTVM